MARILVIDDEEGVCELLRDVLENAGYEVFVTYTAAEGMEALNNFDPDTILLDIKLPDDDGIRVMEKIKDRGFTVPIILMTAFGTTEIAIHAMKEGAHDYLNKPLNLDELIITVQRTVKMKYLVSEVAILREKLEDELNPFDNFIGQSRIMQEISKIIGRIADTDITVLIQGESGTGKEVVARSIHKNSKRNHCPFININCATIPENLMESELFGHEKGSFTGAISQKMGKFELAHSGTVFLDEIGELTHHAQTKLLRVLQEREFERVGGINNIKVDIRILAATNKDLQKLVEEGKFREDLFYRLNVVNIKLPPLKDRKEDIILLVNYYINKFAQKHVKKITSMSKEALNFMINYPWPGNVRELINTCEQAVVMTRGTVILPDDLAMLEGNRPSCRDSDLELNIKLRLKRPIKDILAEVEKQVIIKTLKDHNWSRQESANTLGFNRRSLYAKMKEYDLL
ncbi:sigma-54 dependent transcriptional regulator [Desulfosporosinus sp. BICA1-9]|uniref:sigma-54-dependent transcriptional regulator n=1 Tax=Desulfosporosinus sp. BICA1-9 TaxID=1531958 RepID=UPI00054C76F3|nr:sigma-54 dependent transcriptional regulator [Desulfosporosinus sp. BICA1-9]KJS50477.1 MAG: transcriptional regulator [Peptococcaceae bacterium BRH_c23]KJS85373.1 MAG: transcriptional regulator [Desulfosporosinus sp. BICA1-9]HBW36855.1 sigma-54-dependent Fis family transcriptional regulator [Desulfosporosinus sp.]